MFVFVGCWCYRCCCFGLLFVILLTKYRGPYPQYGWHFPEETPEKFRKDPGNALRAFPGIPVEYGWDAPNPINQGI